MKLKHLKNKVIKFYKLFSLNIAILFSFVLFKFTFLSPMIVYAETKGGSSGSGGTTSTNLNNNFQLQAPKGGVGGLNQINDWLNGFAVFLQGFGSVSLVLGTVWIGTRIGYASAFGDARGRQEALRDLIGIIASGFVIIHARQIVHLAAGG